MNDDITLTLSRADAEWLRRVSTLALSYGPVDAQNEDRAHRLRAAVESALAAPAEGPERAATWETLEQAIATCERRGWRLTLASGRNGAYDAEVLNQTGRVSLGNARSWRPLAALQDAMAEAIKYDVPAAIGGGGEG